MTVIVITPPTVALVSLDEAKAHLRVDHDDDNTRIQDLIWAAQNELVGPDGTLGCSFSVQQLELQLNRFPSCDDIALPCPPLLLDDDHVLTVKYIDANGVEMTVAPSVYSAVSSGSKGAARLALNYNQFWPSPRWQFDAVRIRYFAGYLPDDKRAEGLKSAIKLHVEMNYDEVDAEKWRRTIDRCLAPYQVY